MPHRELSRLALRSRYLLGLGLIGLLSLVGGSLLYVSIQHEKDAAAIVNMSGKQRSFSQRLAMLTSHYAFTSNEEEAASIKREIMQNMSEMHDAHQFLLQGDQTLSVPRHKSEAVLDIFYKPPAQLDLRLLAYHDHIRQLMSLSREELQARPEAIAETVRLAKEILPYLDQVVQQYQQSSESMYDKLLQLNTLIFSSIALILLLEIFFIFLPMERVIMNKQRYLLESKLKAERSEKVKSEFLANMSHEIRTPMNGIIGIIQVLNRSKLDEKQQMLVNVMNDSASDLMQIVNDILDFSRIEAGHVQYELIPTDIAEIAEQSLELFRTQANGKTLALHLKTPSRQQMIYLTDPLRLRQILNNLLSNAIKFTAEGSITLRVSTVQEGGARMIELAVEDTGIGIPAHKCEEIFQEFQQADGSTTREYGGTGLGLAICKRMIEAQGGRIWAEPNHPKGTRFIVRLPAKLPKGNEDD